MIPVVIWTWGLGGLRPAPFFAEICRQSEEREIDDGERCQENRNVFMRVSVRHLYAVAVTSLQALDDCSHHVVVSLGDIEADVLHQLLLLVHVDKVGRDVAVGLLRRLEGHLDAVHLLRDH